MGFRHYNVNIIIRIVILALLCILGTVYIIKVGVDIYFLIIVLLTVFIGYNLFRYLNKANDELSYFFASIINEDSSLVYSEHTGNKTFDSLHKYINRLNVQIKDARMNIIIQEKF